MNFFPLETLKISTQQHLFSWAIFSWVRFLRRLTRSVLLGFVAHAAVLYQSAFVKRCLRHQLKGYVTVAHSWEPVVKHCFPLKEVCEGKTSYFQIRSFVMSHTWRKSQLNLNIYKVTFPSGLAQSVKMNWEARGKTEPVPPLIQKSLCF